jgi:alpha-L-fucosidase
MKRPDTSWFVNNRFGMFIHWGLYALAARHEWVKSAERISTSEYQKYFDHFNPDLFDPKDWARRAREAGMKYFVITAKHHDGFCLWDTKHTDYKSTKTPYGKEILKEVLTAFRAEGLKVGLYYSLLDWHHPEYTIDRHHPMRDNKEEREKNKKRDMRKYARYMREQVTELLTKHGKIDIIWFDFSFPGNDGKGHKDWESEKLNALVRKLQPHILIDNRLDLPGSGDFVTPEQVQPEKPQVDENGKPSVWEACQTFAGSWGYFRDELTWKNNHQLLYMLIDGISKNGNLLLNVGPTARGEFDYRARERLAGMGEWMKYHNKSIYGCGPAPEELSTPQDCRYTYNPKTQRLYLHILSWPFMHIWCKGLAGKVEYAQFLNDASEIKFENKTGDALVLNLPKLQPNVEIPVIELFLTRKK